MYKTISYKKVIARLCIALVLLVSFYTAHAQDSLSYNHGVDKLYGQQKGWRLHPISIKINPRDEGMVLPLPLLDLSDSMPATRPLFFWKASTDISITYVKYNLWQYFDCYPKLGLNIAYNGLYNQGRLLSGIIYLEPNYNHTTTWEFLPRLGIGMAYLTMPGYHFSSDPSDEEKQKMLQVADFRKGASLNLSLDFLWKLRLAPKWYLYAGIGLDYLPDFTKQDQGEDQEIAKKHLTFLNASLGGSYILNPSPYNYARLQTPKKSRIDVSVFNSFRKAQENPDEAQVDKPYYPLVGLYTQGSLQLLNNHALTLASEWVKDWATKEEIKGKARKDFLQVGFLAGHEFLWGPVTFGQALGIYLLNSAISPPLGSFYTRFTLNYHLTKFFFIGTSLKTVILPDKQTLAKLNYVDFRIGYSF